tara:strand:- start:48 stop:308 length:261 start_codon:yes stop_codon:yes gene_type:complete
MNNDIENLKKKLTYRSLYRGTKEMDKLIGTFVKTYINDLDFNELNDLEKFLDIDDDTLYRVYNDQSVEKGIPNNKIILLFKNFIYE